MGANSWQYRYDTGWIERSDWTNVHLGSDTTLNTDSNVRHNLNAPLSDLLVKVFVSTDGTDANSRELSKSGTVADNRGYDVFAVDNNNIKIQTGNVGCTYLDDAGSNNSLDTEDWFYKVKVWYIG